MSTSEEPQRRDARRSIESAAMNSVGQAGLLFVATGLVGVVNDLVPGLVGHGHRASLYLDLVTLVVGLASLFLQRWRRLRIAASIILPSLAMIDIAVNNAFGFLPTATYGTWFVLIFVWVGIWYPPWTVAVLSPIAVAAYLIPLFVKSSPTHDVVTSVLLVIPAAVLSGETVAYFTSRLRKAALEREMLLSDIARQAVTDDLTGVGNRRLGDLLLLSLVGGDAVALLDLDHFKKVNDENGHPEGDRFLRSFGNFLNRSSRERDAVARMGGEEFMIVLRGAGLEGEVIVTRLLESWRTTSPLTTFSAGVALHRARSSPHTTYLAADRALYQAKLEGRDRVILANAARDRPSARTRE